VDGQPGRDAGSHGDPCGRRGNGLLAAEWGALVDVDPRLSSALLGRLAMAGVAAYVEPAGGTSDPISRASTLPPRPLDRLWVDPTRADDARAAVGSEVREFGALLREDDPAASTHGLVQPVPRGAVGRVLTPPALPEPPRPTDDDAQWRAIVASYERPAPGPVRPWPAQEDLDPLPTWLEPEPVEDEGHFEPPPPPPVPRLRARTFGAAMALALGVLLLFAPQLFDLPPSAGATLLGMLLTAGGAGGLVWWMRDAREPGVDPDDGAVV